MTSLPPAGTPDETRAPDGRGARLASIVAVIVVVASVIALYLRHVIFARGPAGIAVQAAAVALMLWARWTFGRRSFHAAANPTAGGLVTWGPYRWLRHPIYAAILWFLWAGVLSHGLAPVPIAFAVLATLATVTRMLAEERLLRAAYPEYAEYAARTKRVVPGVV